MRDCQATSGGQAKVVRRRLDVVRHFSALESAGYLLGHVAAPATLRCPATLAASTVLCRVRAFCLNGHVDEELVRASLPILG